MKLYVLLSTAILVIDFSAFTWSMNDHEYMTKISLSTIIIDAISLEKIADEADNPDFWHISCPLWEAPCLHGHRITIFLCEKDGRFYKEHALGAEHGAIYWAQKAREAYLNGNSKWRDYLGWATHYLADAVCPPHCADTRDKQEWWDDRSIRRPVTRAEEFELDFEPQKYDAYLKSPPLEMQREIPPFPSKPDQMVQWIIQRAKEVSAMELPIRQTSVFKVDFPYLKEVDLQKVMAIIGIGIRGLYNYVIGKTVAYITTNIVTASVLVMDVSGSMGWTWRGGVKIESAKKAALQYVELVANEPRPIGVMHYIGVVTFSDSAQVVCPLTTNYTEAKKTIINLGTIAWTNLGAGLDVALQELSKLSAGQKFIILLSDGMTNTGKSRETILQTSVAEARRQGICIHTVGFGDPGDIDEEFLKKIAIQSGCGSYNYASSGFELFTTYVKVRHATLGSNRIVEYKTTLPAHLFPGQSVTLGAFQLTAPAQELHYTVAWSGPATLQAKLVDPKGKTVSIGYPNSVIYSGNGFSHVTIFSPSPGIWKAAIIVKNASGQPVEYYGVASARTGGIVIPYYVPPCLVEIDNTCLIPMPDLPTVVVVVIGLAVMILWIYNQLGGIFP